MRRSYLSRGYNDTLFPAISSPSALSADCILVLKSDVRWILGFSPGYGWDGITVATLAGLNPFAVLLTGMFFGMLRSASISMNLTNSVPIDMITVLQGLIVILIATPTLWVTLKNGFLLLRGTTAHKTRRSRCKGGVTTMNLDAVLFVSCCRASYGNADCAGNSCLHHQRTGRRHQYRY